jgi:hypothetical protein
VTLEQVDPAVLKRLFEVVAGRKSTPRAATFSRANVIAGNEKATASSR